MTSVTHSDLISWVIRAILQLHWILATKGSQMFLFLVFNRRILPSIEGKFLLKATLAPWPKKSRPALVNDLLKWDYKKGLAPWLWWDKLGYSSCSRTPHEIRLHLDLADITLFLSFSCCILLPPHPCFWAHISVYHLRILVTGLASKESNLRCHVKDDHVLFSLQNFTITKFKVLWFQYNLQNLITLRQIFIKN